MADGVAREIRGSMSRLERPLQEIFERHLSELFGIRLLATEYITGGEHGGRIDTLGLDENHCPVIVEYKRHKNENVVSQALFYLDWLLKNKAEFQLFVAEKLGHEASDKIDFGRTRLLCIAGDYTKYDLYAVNYIGPNIEMIAYRRYGSDLLLLDYVAGRHQPVKALISEMAEVGEPATSLSDTDQTNLARRLSRADDALVALFGAVRDRILSLGEDVQLVETKGHYAFKRLRNIACVGVLPTKGCVTMYLRVDPSTIELEAGFTRDVSETGHCGTGDLEVVVRSEDDLKRAMPYLRTAYEAA